MGGHKNTGNKRLICGALLTLAFSLLLLCGIGAACMKKQAADNRSASELVGETGIAGDEDSDGTESAANAKETGGTEEAASTDGTETADHPEGTDDTAADNASDSEKILGQILVNEPVTELESLDTTAVDWGLGKAKDDKGRPIDAVNAQEKYDAYNALFLGEGENTIYLTFDEGYEYGYTESILNTLKEKNVKAVFFVTEAYAKSEPELVQRMIDEGHVIGNHSASHPSAGLTSMSWEQQQNEVMENHEYVLAQFDYHMYLFRYPAGRFSEQSLAIVNNCNYKSVFWSFAYLDYDVKNQPEPKESLAKMEDRLHPGAIYLLHAESETNAAVLGAFIDFITEQGYSLGTL